MKTFWCLYRENPFQVLCSGGHFRSPEPDRALNFRIFAEESDARLIQLSLRERTFIGKRSYIRQRIKNHEYTS